MCTGQEALDEIIAVRQRVQPYSGSLKVHLSLTSSSADEVIQKRLLKKTILQQNCWKAFIPRVIPCCAICLPYDAMLDIKGYSAGTC